MSDEVEVRFFEFLRRFSSQSDSSSSRQVGRSAGCRRKHDVMNFLAVEFYALVLKLNVQVIETGICQ